MLSVALIDDEEVAISKLRECFSFLETKVNERFRIDAYKSADHFFINFNSQYNIVFFDIEMPDMDGMTAARRLRELDKTVVIVFVTNSARYAVQGYEVDALDYILKPVEKDAFVLKMQRVLARVANRQNAKIVIRTEGRMEYLQVSQVKYLEVMGHTIVYHTYYGDYTVYGTLSAEEKKLPEGQFARCNRSCLVNLMYVKQVSGGECMLADESLPVGRTQKKKFIAVLQNYLCGEND